ncbi:hypothetical protein [Beijerinckia mobilis]|uniref:hypothetical protein n=1 Tax=Beijerinckia mobilis TaxID=231434 RepID=UPI0005569FD6|nr:hypothetical protein [Beijerinckia mobilis]
MGAEKKYEIVEGFQTLPWVRLDSVVNRISLRDDLESLEAGRRDRLKATGKGAAVSGTPVVVHVVTMGDDARLGRRCKAVGVAVVVDFGAATNVPAYRRSFRVEDVTREEAGARGLLDGLGVLSDPAYRDAVAGRPVLVVTNARGVAQFLAAGSLRRFWLASAFALPDVMAAEFGWSVIETSSKALPWSFAQCADEAVEVWKISHGITGVEYWPRGTEASSKVKASVHVKAFGIALLAASKARGSIEKRDTRSKGGKLEGLSTSEERQQRLGATQRLEDVEAFRLLDEETFGPVVMGWAESNAAADRRHERFIAKQKEERKARGNGHGGRRIAGEKTEATLAWEAAKRTLALAAKREGRRNAEADALLKAREIGEGIMAELRAMK